MRHSTCLLLSVVTIALVGMTDDAGAADIDCGAVLTEDTVLTGGTLADSFSEVLGTPCASDPMVTLDGATLDLNGFTIESGAAGGTAVRVTGKGGGLENGAIRDGGATAKSIEAVGAGGYRFENLYIDSGGSFTIASTAPKNRLRNVHFANVDTVDIDSGGNTLVDVSVAGGSGITIVGDNNKIVRLTSHYVGTPGLMMTGDKNKVTDSTLSNCTGDDSGAGISVLGDRNQLRNNVGFLCSILVEGDGNKIDRNAVSFCVGQPCFEIAGENNKVTSNRAVNGDGREDGMFVVSSGVGNVVAKNAAVGAFGSPSFNVIGDATKLIANTAVASGDPSFRLAGADSAAKKNIGVNESTSGSVFVLDDTASANELKGNFAFGNSNGISANAGSSSNVITRNVAVGALSSDLEAEAACANGNVWSQNVFHDTEEPCVD